MFVLTSGTQKRALTAPILLTMIKTAVDRSRYSPAWSAGGVQFIEVTDKQKIATGTLVKSVYITLYMEE